MAISTSNGSWASRRQRARHGAYKPMSEINVTPPLLTVGIPVNLTQTKADAISDPQEPLVITMDSAGKIFLQETEVDVDSLVAKLQAITQNKTDTRIFVRADRDIAYGKVMVVMGGVTSAGFTQVALITDTAVP